MFELLDGRSSAYQWDTSLYVDCTGLAESDEVHFCRPGITLALHPAMQGETLAASVPDELLQQAQPIIVFAYTGEITRVSARLCVTARPKPPGYIASPTEALRWEHLQEQIGDLADLKTQDKTSLVAALNEAMAQGGDADPEAVQQIVENYLAENPPAAGADGADGLTPTIGANGNWYLGDTDTGKPSRGETGPAGADGANGKDGADGPAGTPGKSAYAYAVEGGYTGTESEFAAKLAEEYIPSPAAAAVGQTIRVKAVDSAGRPTEWEAADMASGDTVVTIASRTTEEDTTFFEFTDLPDCKSYVFSASIPKYATASGVSVIVNDVTCLTGGNYFVHPSTDKEINIEIRHVGTTGLLISGNSAMFNSPYNFDTLVSGYVTTPNRAAKIEKLKIALLKSDSRILSGAVYRLEGIGVV